MMHQKHQDILIRNRLLLVRGLKVTETLMTCLRLDYTLTNEMQQEIEAEKTDAQKVGALLDNLARRGDKAFDRFLYAMIETDQDNLAMVLDNRIAKKYIDQRNSTRRECEQHCGDQNRRLQVGQTAPMLMIPSGGQQPLYGVSVFPTMFPPHYMGYPYGQPLTLSGATVAQPMQPNEDSSLQGATYRVEELNAVLQEINGLDEQTTKAVMNFTVKAATNLHRSSDSMVYQMSHIPRGRAVIINNRYFVSDKYTNRDGAQHDMENLKNLFEQLSFTVIVHENKGAEEIRYVLKEESKEPDHEKADMFVLFLLSHGNQGNIFGIDGESLSIENDITALFYPEHCPALKGKPKVFFIQACQGRMRSGKYVPDSDKWPPEQELDESLIKKLDKLALEDKKGFVPGYHQRSDIVMSYATVKGYLAWRRSDLGSWFVRCLVSVFSRRAHCDHLLDMLTETNFLLSKLETSSQEGQSHQLAEKTDTLNKKLYFFPGA